MWCVKGAPTPFSMLHKLHCLTAVGSIETECLPEEHKTNSMLPFLLILLHLPQRVAIPLWNYTTRCAAGTFWHSMQHKLILATSSALVWCTMVVKTNKRNILTSLNISVILMIFSSFPWTKAIKIIKKKDLKKKINKKSHFSITATLKFDEVYSKKFM